MKQALSLIGVSFLSVVSSLAADKKPNIILILADDMRASGMNFLGKEQVQTPNLDKLAGESTVFTNAQVKPFRKPAIIHSIPVNGIVAMKP